MWVYYVACLGLGVLCFLALFAISVRNYDVFEYRCALIKSIAAAAQTDIRAGRDWYWRYEEFDKVCYTDMVAKFWKPLDSFFEQSPARELR